LGLRRQVAKEAARLLYTRAAEEYKHAKETAARNLGVETLPSNHEVAVELDQLAVEIEGDGRRRLLVRMRELSVGIMEVLAEYDPVLRGSVWRGTARKGSDIDIDVYSDNPDVVAARLTSTGYEVASSESVVAVRSGRDIRSTHILISLEEGIQGEVVVRPVEEKDTFERCEIYGDMKRGLRLSELEKLMKTDPLRKFVPGRRYR